MRLFLIFFATAAAAFSQLSFGVKGGIPLTDTLNVAQQGSLAYTTSTKRYTLGPTVELRLPWGLGVEFDALYKRVDYNSASTDSTSATTGGAWQFPLLLKKRFGSGLMRPYLGAGPSFQHLFDLNQVTTFLGNRTSVGASSTGSPSEVQNNSTMGGVVEGGVEFHLGPLKVSPEIRYTRWSANTFQSAVRQVLNLNSNQAEILVGLTL